MIRITNLAMCLALVGVPAATHAQSILSASFCDFNGCYSFEDPDYMFLGVAPFIDGNNYVMAYDARDTNQCRAYFLVTSGTPSTHIDSLRASISVSLDDGSDYFWVVGDGTYPYQIGGANGDLCRNLPRLGNLAYDGYELYVYGGDQHDVIAGGNGKDVLNGQRGNDEVIPYGQQTDEARGGPGNDLIISGHYSCLLMGDSGLDSVWSYRGRHDHLWGGGSDDCLADTEATAFDCGTGQDRYWYPPGQPPGPAADTCKIAVDWGTCVNWSRQ